MIEKQFVEIIETTLLERGWSRSDLARAMGVGPQMVTDYLNGRKKPGAEVIERFFRALDLVPELTAYPARARV